MIEVQVTRRAYDPDVPPFQTTGFVPFKSSPLAVTRAASFTGEWREISGRWRITHRPTGYCLTDHEFDSFEEAMRVLNLCDPTFPAWPLALAQTGNVARDACRYKFRVAMEAVAA